MKMTTLQLRNSVNGSHVRLAFLLIPLVCFHLSPQARATCQQGCLTNDNTVLGEDALSNNIGSNNTAVGFNALYSNTIGELNTAAGYRALYSNTDASGMTAFGFQALFTNTSGIFNTAVGVDALYFNTIGELNTATGGQALEDNTTGSQNTANGFGALRANTSGSNNTATGFLAMAGPSSAPLTGSNNTATGFSALYLDTTGISNTASGANALFSNTIGNNNTGIGYQALLNNTTGSFNIAVGNGAGGNLTTGVNNIDIGNNGVAGESKTIRIGNPAKQMNTFIAGISGVTVAGGVGVIIDNNGHFGTIVSSARFKKEIKPMDKASEAILALKPVSFRYKHDLDPEGIPQFGLVAEEVEKVNPDLVARDDQGKPYTVRYEAVNAMLLNEFLKEHRTVQQLKSTAAKQEATIAHQQKQIEALIAGLQKVSAQLAAASPSDGGLEISKAGPRTIAANQ